MQKSTLLRLSLIGIGVALALGVMEGTLRLIYWDAGERTLGGPGGKSFMHETIDGVRRGRLDVGPKTPGVPRVMVVGDSITYGLGVREWTATWPERLARRLEQTGRPHQFAVFAVPGNDMPQHLEAMRGAFRRVQPDIFIYQWYVNDIEAISHRPSVDMSWRRLPWHESLRMLSYTYFVLDHQLGQVFGRPGETYITYLKSGFVPGTPEWTEFEREFHEFAALARPAGRRILMLYPQVPYHGEYPLQALHRRIRELVAPHILDIPPLAWTRTGGALVTEPQSRWGQAIHAMSGSSPMQVQTRDYLFAPGDVELHVLVAAPRGETGRVELVDPVRETALVSAPIRGEEHLADVALHLRLTGDRVRRLAVRVTTPGHSEWVLANIGIPVNYGFDVIDLTEPLNAIDTHASAFDSHPNERAHEVIASAVYDEMLKLH